ncbi:hypothetical protein [Streptomyces sp. NBC_01264]|uniref:hypothetical protein n=1 Tax=Streptomyces sp. NBC_01264 TaxID=2903804 RepID=UPI002B1DB3C0|nr:hypothetical protein [Streptomyces sp. NBC_01264]
MECRSRSRCPSTFERLSHLDLGLEQLGLYFLRAGEGGLLQQLTQRILESALEGEITDHLGHEKHKVFEGMHEWQNRPLDSVYPVLPLLPVLSRCRWCDRLRA